jgi:hypothetical protein
MFSSQHGPRRPFGDGQKHARPETIIPTSELEAMTERSGLANFCLINRILWLRFQLWLLRQEIRRRERRG